MSTEQVSQVTWTGDGNQGIIGPGQFQDFGISTQIPDKPGTTLTFKALQTYEGGEVVRWIGAPDSEDPAPHVNVTAPAPRSRRGRDTRHRPADASKSDDDDEDDDVLPIIALVSGSGLLLGGGRSAFFLTPLGIALRNKRPETHKRRRTQTGGRLQPGPRLSPTGSPGTAATARRS